jgi:anaerobic ribonucleoside-triphosphate reductase activating protein
MHYGTIKYCDIANGEGVRTSLFVSGCTHRCRECFQPETWDFAFGQPFDEKAAEEIIESLGHPWIHGLTVLGGEPMEPVNQQALAPFLEEVRRRVPQKSIWMYTGDTWEALASGPRRADDTDTILHCLDVLIDGPFEESLKDITLRFRGSSNQRVIDVPATLATGRIIEWNDDPDFSTHRMD